MPVFNFFSNCYYNTLKQANEIIDLAVLSLHAWSIQGLGVRFLHKNLMLGSSVVIIDLNYHFFSKESSDDQGPSSAKLQVSADVSIKVWHHVLCLVSL